MAGESERGTFDFRDPAIAAGFTTMPNFVLRHEALSPGAKVLYLLLLSYAWQTDRCWPGQERLAQDLRVTDRTVRNWLAEIKTAGLITIEQRGLRQTNIYIIERWQEEGHFRSDRKQISGQGRKQRSAQDRKLASAKELPEGKGSRGKRPPPPTPTVDLSTRLPEAATNGVHHGNGALGDVWAVALTDLREQILPTNFARWLSRARLLGVEGGEAVIGVPDRVSAEQLAKRFDTLVRQAISDACGEPVTVRYEGEAGET